jgi:hypothetical protein
MSIPVPSPPLLDISLAQGRLLLETDLVLNPPSRSSNLVQSRLLHASNPVQSRLLLSSNPVPSSSLFAINLV